jgi:hypothetical protein
MKKISMFCLLAFVLFFIPFNAISAPKVSIEILYMNHGPLMSTLDDIKSLLGRYKDTTTVFWHDFETSEGEKFMAKKGIHEHVPLMIWINGKSSYLLNGKEVKFAGFPSGSGPEYFQGKWTMVDLRKVLDLVTHKK